MNNEEKVTYFGETDARNKRVLFGIKKKDRSRHMYVIGKTGMGKSTLLENLAIQDIQNGEGLAFIDPHGKTADLLLEYVPEHRIKDVVYFAPFDLDHPISFNVLEDVGPERRHLVANGLMTAFKKIWVDAWSARMEYILTNIILALLEYPGSTLMGVNRMLVDKDFRKTIVDNISDPSVKAFWTEEYAKYTDKFAAEAAPAIQNKVGQFVANPLVRNIIGQSTSSFDIRKIMDEKKILIINLSKGRVGEANANLLGAMIITKIYLAAMSRADLNENDLKNSAQFYLYVDEFQSFANESFADILSEARKYKLNLTIAHQYIEQMTEEVRAAVFGNVGTMVAFRVGAYDGAVFEKEFAPQFSAENMVNLQQYQMYLKLMIDGVTSTPFSAMGMSPIPKPKQTFVQEIIDASRSQFAKSRIEVEDIIRNWHIEKIQPVGPDGKIMEKHDKYSSSVSSSQSSLSKNTQSPYSNENFFPEKQNNRNYEKNYDQRSVEKNEYRSDKNKDYLENRNNVININNPSSSKYVAQKSFQQTSFGSNNGQVRDVYKDPSQHHKDPSQHHKDPSQRHNSINTVVRGEISQNLSQDRFSRNESNNSVDSTSHNSFKNSPSDSFNRDMTRNSAHHKYVGQYQENKEIEIEKQRVRQNTRPEYDNTLNNQRNFDVRKRDQYITEQLEDDKRKSHNRDRERSLMDAVSLNYLKNKNEEGQKSKNAEKEAKAENVFALKEALLGLLNESAQVNFSKETTTNLGEQEVMDGRDISHVQITQEARNVPDQGDVQFQSSINNTTQIQNRLQFQEQEQEQNQNQNQNQNKDQNKEQENLTKKKDTNEYLKQMSNVNTEIPDIGIGISSDDVFLSKQNNEKSSVNSKEVGIETLKNILGK